MTFPPLGETPIFNCSPPGEFRGLIPCEVRSRGEARTLDEALGLGVARLPLDNMPVDLWGEVRARGTGVIGATNSVDTGQLEDVGELRKVGGVDDEEEDGAEDIVE